MHLSLFTVDIPVLVAGADGTVGGNHSGIIV